MPKVLVLLSGGLDSRLALKLMQNQKIPVEAVYFDLPFGTGCCSPRCAYAFAQSAKVPLHIIDCTKGKNFYEYISIVRNPQHGYGSAINPCIDCHAFMLKKAARLMRKIGARFVVTGEVLGERPFSQNARALKLVERIAGLEGLILRPLSAALLQPTIPELRGWVDRKKMLDIQGRRRVRQLALAKQFGITHPTPAGGCLLTQKEFAAKLRDLFAHKKKITPRDCELLKIGRHFRFGGNKIIVGRNMSENMTLLKLVDGELIFEVPGVGSPITLLQGKPCARAIRVAAALTARYSDAKDARVLVKYGKNYGKSGEKLKQTIKVSKFSQLKLE
jgi:tRNA U34 2-thiouridine synthase MnmA/TrmU